MKKVKVLVSIFSIILLSINGCQKLKESGNINESIKGSNKSGPAKTKAITVTDIDGNVYNTITIGTQIWMVENLKVTRYRNGDPILNITDNAAWAGSTTGADCWYGNNVANKDTYGALYNWYAVNENRNIAPAGWHVPTEAERDMLDNFLGGVSVAGGKLKEAGISHWGSPNTGASNSSGFTAFPAGYRIGSTGTFDKLTWHTYLWSSTQKDAITAFRRQLKFDSEGVAIFYGDLKSGFSVRLVKDNVTSYLGQVATQSRLQTYINTSAKQAMARSRHVAQDNISSLQLVFANWYQTTAYTNGETGTGGVSTITASVEYPVGVFTLVKFGGLAQGTIPELSNIVSDGINLSTPIPAGAVFYVRSYCTNPAGLPWTKFGDKAKGEALIVGTSGIADLTMGGTVTTNYGVTTYCPVAIIGQTTKSSLFIIGDSRAVGVKDWYSGSEGALEEIARSLAPSLGYITAACAGSNLQGFIASNSLKLSLAKYTSHVICEYGINDLFASGRTASQVLADQQTVYNLFPSKPVYQTTLPPESSSTDSWATVGNQTTLSANSNRVQVNNAIRAGPNQPG